MLGRTAGNLFWMSRYMERVESIARLMDAGYRMSLTPGLDEGHRDQWGSVLAAAGLDKSFAEKHDEATLANVVDFMLFDKENASSAWSCLLAARTNARTERIAITQEMWESLNGSWLEFSAVKPGTITSSRLPELLEWIKSASNQFRGALLGTILRHENFMFSQLGCFIERADNTARLLDVKYYILLPRTEMLGGDVDTVQWEMILRAVSAHRSYRHVYRDNFAAANIAEFLILRASMPRSLKYAYDMIDSNAEYLEDFYGSPQAFRDDVATVSASLTGRSIDELFEYGLHEFIREFIGQNKHLAGVISDNYNFG